MVTKINALQETQRQLEALQNEIGLMRDELQVMAPEKAPELAEQRRKEAALVNKVFDPRMRRDDGIGG